MTTRVRAFAAPLLLAASLAGLATGCADDAGLPTAAVEPEDPDALLVGAFSGPSSLRVMSRNLYLGGDIGPVLGASDPSQIPVLVAQTWAMIQATNFPERARTIAREIALTRPDVIGLQEVALFRTQSPGDFLLGNPMSAADVAFDYLEILLEQLRRFGLRYEVATVVENIDVELPAATSPTTFDDIRYTDRDVVLVRRGIQVDAAASGNYVTKVSFPVAGAVPIDIPRGWNRVDLVHRGVPYHFVNTHLETDETSVVVQKLQAQELVQMLSGVQERTFVVGDLNGTPDDATNTRGIILDAGFSDLWTSSRFTRRRPGFTCCFDPDLLGGELFERIDYIFARGSGEEEVRGSLAILGSGRTTSGLRPSDHAGLVGTADFSGPPRFGEGSGND